MPVMSIMSDVSKQPPRSLSPLRNANWRSMTSMDPAIVELLEATDHAISFTHDEQGEWKRNRAEGPTFLVRRSQEPHYAVCMLNRTTIQNLHIPLVQGEVKTTLLSPQLLQIRRRGQVGRSLWIPEDHDPTGIARFHARIQEICGEPVRKANVLDSPSAQPTHSDPFAHLFESVNTSEPASTEQITQPAWQSSGPDASTWPPTLPSNAVQTSQNAESILMGLLGAAPPAPLPAEDQNDASAVQPSTPKYSPPGKRKSLNGSWRPQGRVGDASFAQAARTRPSQTRAPKVSAADRLTLVQAIASTLVYRHGSPPPSDPQHIEALQRSVRETLVGGSLARRGCRRR